MPIKTIFKSILNDTDRPDSESNHGKIETSEAIASLVRYVKKHQDSDMLVTGFDEASTKNPYRRVRANKCCCLM